MTIVYYDNLESTPAEDQPGLVEVERVYCFDWDRFLDFHWQELLRSYDALPGAVSYPEDGVPWWFGQDEETPPFLWASVEPPGLQVYGVLPEADWLAWDEQFRSGAGELPVRMLQ